MTEIEQMELQARRTRAEAAKLEAEALKLKAETDKLAAEERKHLIEASLTTSWGRMAIPAGLGTVLAAILLAVGALIAKVF